MLSKSISSIFPTRSVRKGQLNGCRDKVLTEQDVSNCRNYTLKKTGTITLTILDLAVDLEIVHNSIREGITAFVMTFFSQ